ncbi:type VI secretion system Vgr family protein [Melittangium boletus]|uniref:type VI secretion system Vgr family protein n=1 Tax=Melittangium boletus TaxID=83453 RepID=UPI003DA2C5D2
MSQTAKSAFSFQVGSHTAENISVSHVSGREGLSCLYEFQVGFHPREDAPLETGELLGAEALLTLHLPGGEPRLIHGRVRAVESLGPREGRWCYQAWVVPAAWWLTRVQRCRIFQGQTVPQIVAAILEEGGVEVELSLGGGSAVREYCTQYRETDFAFVSRLLEEEGLFYFFTHAEDGHVLRIGDDPSVHPALPGGASLPLREDDERVEAGEFLSSIQRVQRLRPGAVHLKDYDFEKPALNVSGKARAPAQEPVPLEVYDYPGGHSSPAAGKALATVRLEEAVQAARTLEGRGRCPRLTPGYRFHVEDAGSHAGEYVAVEVLHSGRQPETSGQREALGALYHTQFKCMPAKVPFRPRRMTPVPHIAGVQTAMVVGVAGEEIHTDAHGRVKVQFHWDREGQRDDRASCWVRVGQAWGGPAWGALYLPRIGQEVLVRFLEGNPDRPLLAGAVYNGSNPTPYALPGDKTRSTLKSASSLGSDGFNEFRIEDAAGQEEIFVHGQKDEALTTGNDKDQEVLGHERLLVKKDRARTVEGHQVLSVAGEDAAWVGDHQSLRVTQDRTTHIQANHSEAVEGTQSITVAKSATVTARQASMESVGAAKALTIGAGYSINVALAQNEAVGGIKTAQVGAASSETVVGSRQELVAQDKETKIGRHVQADIKGALSLSVGKDSKEDVGKNMSIHASEAAALLAKSFEVKVDTFSIIVDGKLALRIEKSGKVLIAGKNVTLGGK